MPSIRPLDHRSWDQSAIWGLDQKIRHNKTRNWDQTTKGRDTIFQTNLVVSFINLKIGKCCLSSLKMIYLYLAFHLYQITNICVTEDSQDVLYGVWNLEYLLYPLSKIVTLLWTSIKTEVEADQWPCNAWHQHWFSSVGSQVLHLKCCIVECTAVAFQALH